MHHADTREADQQGQLHPRRRLIHEHTPLYIPVTATPQSSFKVRPVSWSPPVRVCGYTRPDVQIPTFPRCCTLLQQSVCSTLLPTADCCFCDGLTPDRPCNCHRSLPSVLASEVEHLAEGLLVSPRLFPPACPVRHLQASENPSLPDADVGVWAQVRRSKTDPRSPAARKL